MARKRDELMFDIKGVEREYSAMRLASDRLLTAVTSDPTVLVDELTPRDIRHAAERLEATYVIRLFAVYEAGLRQFWSIARGPVSPSRTRDLLDGVAATRSIPYQQRIDAHAVREFRNTLVHVRDEAAAAIPICDARRILCRFLSHLPPHW